MSSLFYLTNVNMDKRNIASPKGAFDRQIVRIIFWRNIYRYAIISLNIERSKGRNGQAK